MRINVTRNHLRVAVLVLGGILIVFGALKLAFKLDFGSFIDQNLPSAIIFAAIAIFGWNRYLVAQEKKAQEAEEAKLKAAETPGDTEEASKEPTTPGKEEPKVES